MLELLISTIIAQANVENVLKELQKEGFTVEGPPASITITDNGDGTVTVEGPADNEKRLDALYQAISDKRRQIFDNNTEIFNLFNSHGSLFDFPDSLKVKIEVLEAKNTILRSEIAPLETEYNSIFKQLYPELKELVK